MSKQVDERVVEMRFDNKQFESATKESMTTLDKLKQKLQLKDASKGFIDIGEAVKKVDLNPIGKAAEIVTAKFSAIQVAGVTAIANLTNSAVNAAKNITKSLTITPVITGFNEYETQIGAVQTILANTSHQGTNLQQVNRALDELNTYADKTIYNFTEMTRNIGTFTAAGVDLQTSVDSIKGIANLAAVSGSTSQQASTAMYQLSQALAAGKVSLMDWNSVVNAGMGGKVFQDALIRTSELLGTGAKQAVDTYGSFRESLTKSGWLTTEVLTETLKQFAGAYSEADLIQQGFTTEQAQSIAKMAKTAEDAATKVKTFTQLFDTLKESAQSGWTQTWEILVGDFEEAKSVLTEASEAIGGIISKSAEARNELLSGGLSSGWKQLLGAGIADEAGYIDAIQEVARTHSDAFDKMVADSDNFNNALKNGLQQGIISSETLSEAVFTLQGKMSSMSIEERKAAGYSNEMLVQIEALASGLRNGSISMDEFTDKILRPSGRENLIQSLWNAAKGLMSVITPIKEAFNEIFPPATAQQLYDFTVKLRDLTANFVLSGPAAESLKNVFKGLFSIVHIGIKVIGGFVQGAITLIDAILPVGGGILSVSGSIGEFISKINEALSGTNIFATVFGTLSSIISPVATEIGNALKSISDGVDNLGGIIGVIEKVVSGIQFVFSKIKSVVSSAMDSLGFDSLIDAVNSGLFAGILLGINKFIKSLTNITSNGPGIIGGIRDILDGVSSSLQAFQSQLKAETLLKIASAIAILAGSLVVLSKIDGSKLTSSLGAITGLFIELFGSMTIFEKIAGGSGFESMGKVSRAMIGISTAVLILSAAMKNLASLSWDEIGRGLTATVAGLGTLIGAIYLLPKDTTTKTGSLIGLSTALVILSGALKVMGSMSWDEIGRGLTTLTGSLAILIGSMHLMKSALAGAASIFIISSALVVLSSALKIMGTMSWDEIGRGLTILSGSLAILVGSMHLMTSALAGASSMLIISSALFVLSGALKVMATLSWEEIGKCMTTIAGSLLIMAGAAKILSISGALVILSISGALATLTPTLLALSTMSWEGITKGLLAMAGAFGVIGIAGLLLGLISPMILALGAAVALLGVGCLAAGAGLLAFSTALAALAVSGTAGAAALVTVIEGIIGMIPSLAAAIGMGVVEMAAAIGTGAGAIMTAVTQILNAILQAIIDVTPKVAETVAIILTEILGVIADVTPKVVDTVVTCLSSVFDGIVEFVPKMVEAGLQIITGFLQGIAYNIGGVVKAGVNIITEFLTALGNELPRIVDAGFQMMISFINGLADSISINTPVLTAAIGNLMNAVITAAVTLITGSIGNFLSAGANVFGGFINGLKSKVPSIISTVSSMISKVVSNIKSKVSSFVSSGGELINGFIKGINDKISGVVNAAKEIGSKALSTIKSFLGIASPSKAFIAIGKFVAEGFAQGIRDTTWQAVNATAEMADKVKKAASGTFEDVEKYIADAKHFDELSLAEELEIWETFIARYIEGTEERLNAEKKAYSVYKELYKENYKNSKNWIDAEKEYNRLSLQEELEAWQRVQARYVEGTDERKEADKQVYKLKHELIDNSIEALEQEIELQNKLIATLDKTTNEYRNAVKERQHLNDLLLEAQYKNSTSYVEEKDFYGRERGLVEKLGEQWRIMTLRTKKGSDEYKKAAKEVYSIMKDMYNAEQEYLDDKAEIEKDAAKESEQLEKDKNDKIKEIRKQRDEDIQAADKKYNDELNSRTKALYDSYGLFDEVTEKETVNSATLMKNIQDQVDEFKDWQSVLNSLSARGLNEGLIEELQEMGPSAISEIKALNSMSDSQLQQYATLWSEKHKLAKNKAIDELRDLRTSTNSEIKNLRITAENEIQAATNLYYSKLGELNDKTEGQLFELKTKFEKTVGIIRTDTDEEFTKMAESAKSILTQAGKNMALGLVDGFGSQEGVIYDTIKNVLKKSEKVAKEVTDEHSPSKVYMGIGRYMVEGLVNGIENLKDKAVNTVGTLGHSMINSISSSISRISDVIKSDMDIEPTITPVIDLTNVRNGIGMINGAFGANRSMNLGMAIAANNQNGNRYQSELFGKMQDMAEKSNGKLTSAIDSLRSDFNDMASKLERMQVVLDSGALVGEIAPDMDSALGGLAKMNRRGVR